VLQPWRTLLPALLVQWCRRQLLAAPQQQPASLTVERRLALNWRQLAFRQRPSALHRLLHPASPCSLQSWLACRRASVWMRRLMQSLTTLAHLQLLSPAACLQLQP